MKHDQFYVGQRVKMYDKEDGCNVYGHVIAKDLDSVTIKWGDLDSPCQHFIDDDLEEIKDGSPLSK